MHSYFSWDFLRIFDNSTPYPSNTETLSGYCAYPCNGYHFGVAETISANGGQIDLKFTSDNLSQFRGFWLEYRLGKNRLIISWTSLLIITKILYLHSHIMTNSFLYFHNSSCNRTTWWRCM